MMSVGTRKLIGLFVSLLVCGMLGVMGLLLKTDPLGLAGIMAPIATLYGIFVTGSWMEWRERRLDQSSIADQMRIEQEGQREKPRPSAGATPNTTPGS